MSKGKTDTIKAILFLVIILVLICAISLPAWWLFVIPVVLCGVAVSFLKWNVSALLVGFVSGFIVWVSASMYYDGVYNGDLLNKVGLAFSASKALVILLSGFVGGTVTALALYTGKSMLIFK